MKITKDTTLAEILEIPEAEKVLAKYNVPCLGCGFFQYEMAKLKIGNVCRMYNINLEKLLQELNSDKIKN